MSRSIHVMFNPSGAADLRQALAGAGRKDDVITCLDNLSFGPINPPSADLRARWVDTELGYDSWEDVSATIEPFMAKSLAPDVQPIVWYSKRDTQSFCGFLEWLSRRSDAPVEVVDVTDLSLPGTDINGNTPHLAVSPSLISADNFTQLGLLEMNKALDNSERKRMLAFWQVLKRENSPLRVIEKGGLKSAPIDFFDPLILSLATDVWWKMSLLIGHVLVAFKDNNIHQTGDLLIAARIRALAEAGKMDWRGDLYDMRKCEVRLPSG
jgi:hypothetical protein